MAGHQGQAETNAAVADAARSMRGAREVAAAVLAAGAMLVLAARWIETATISSLGATGFQFKWARDMAVSVAASALAYVQLRRQADGAHRVRGA
jgi:hypothetical protein